MTLEEALRRLNDALARKDEWLVQNSGAVAPSEYTEPVKKWAKRVADLEREAKSDDRSLAEDQG